MGTKTGFPYVRWSNWFSIKKRSPIMGTKTGWHLLQRKQKPEIKKRSPIMGTKTLTFSLSNLTAWLKKDPQSWGRKRIWSQSNLFPIIKLKKDPQLWGRKQICDKEHSISSLGLKKDSQSEDEMKDHDKKPSPMRNLWQGRRSPFSVSESRNR